MRALCWSSSFVSGESGALFFFVFGGFLGDEFVDLIDSSLISEESGALFFFVPDGFLGDDSVDLIDSFFVSEESGSLFFFVFGFLGSLSSSLISDGPNISLVIWFRPFVEVLLFLGGSNTSFTGTLFFGDESVVFRFRPRGGILFFQFKRKKRRYELNNPNENMIGKKRDLFFLEPLLCYIF